MNNQKFYTEDELVQKLQNGEIDKLGFIDGHSQEWQDEFVEFCQQRGMELSNDSAEAFHEWKGDQLEKAMEEGNA